MQCAAVAAAAAVASASLFFFGRLLQLSVLKRQLCRYFFSLKCQYFSPSLSRPLQLSVFIRLYLFEIAKLSSKPIFEKF